MLKETFFTIISSSTKDESTFTSKIYINKEHEIFKGHFPDLPVVPGVCMMQIIKELLEEQLQNKLQLKSAANIKFLSLINPFENAEVDVEISYSKAEDESYVANGVISANNVPYFKIVKAEFN